MSYQPFSKIQFGDNLDVTDLGSGVIRVDGGSGGGAAVAQKAIYNNGSTQTAVASGSRVRMPWYFDRGDDLLDLTDRTAPIVKADGVYIVSGFVVSGGALASGAHFVAVLLLDAYTGLGDYCSNTQDGFPIAGYSTQVGLSNSYYLSAGMKMGFDVVLYDNPGGKNFNLGTVTVVRLP